MTVEADVETTPAGVEPPATPGGPAAAQLPDDLRRSAWWWFRTAAVCVSVLAVYEIVVVLGGFLSALLTVFLYLVFGGVVTYMAGPVVDALVRWARLPRTVAILVTLLGGLAVVVLALYLAAAPTISEVQQLASKVPDFVSRGGGELQRLQDQLNSHGINVNNVDFGSFATDATNRLRDIVVESLKGTITAVVDTIIVFVVAFWLLKDGDRLRAGILGVIPTTARPTLEFTLDSLGVVIGGYVRAQLIMAVIIGTLAGGGCAVLGVPFPFVVGLAAGLFELIPIVGPVVGGIVGVGLALTVSPGLALVTLILFIGIHIVEGYVLAPRIQARFVQLHPLVSLLSLAAGFEVGGFLGALFAVPVASLAAVHIRAYLGDVRASRPELFDPPAVDTVSVRRRQSILREFRLFKRSPAAAIRARLRRRPRPERVAPPRDGDGEAPAERGPA